MHGSGRSSPAATRLASRSAGSVRALAYSFGCVARTRPSGAKEGGSPAPRASASSERLIQLRVARYADDGIGSRTCARRPGWDRSSIAPVSCGYMRMLGSKSSLRTRCSAVSDVIVFR